MYTLKPAHGEAVLAAARQTKAIITAEEQSVIGGLGSAVAEVLTESGDSCVAFRRIGIKDEYCQTVGSQEYLRPSTACLWMALLKLFDLYGSGAQMNIGGFEVCYPGANSSGGGH
jgi:hypothetical protein